MDGYKKIPGGSPVISAPVCSWIFFSTLFSYKHHDQFSIFIMVMLLLVTAAASCLAFRSYSLILDTMQKRAAALVLFILFLSVLFFIINVRTGRIISQDNLPVQVSGFIAKIDSVEKKRYNSDLYFTGEPCPGLHVTGILTYTGCSEIKEGSVVAVHKAIRRVDASENRYLLSLARRGIRFRGTVDDTGITIITNGEDGWRRSLRNTVREKISRTFPGPVSALLIAVYFGDTSSLDKKTMIQFRDAGTLHLLAASGMNIALVASIPMLLLLPAGINRRRVILVSSAVTVFYLLITDMPVSLVRAAVMYMFMTAGFLLSRERNSFNSLYLAGSVIILLMPWEIYNPGFQLSFGATAGILFFYRRYKDSMKNLPGAVSRSLAVTFAAQAAAYPIIYLHMGQFNPAGFITNLLEIPLITAITLLSLSVLCVSLIAPAAAAFSSIPVTILCRSVSGLNGFVSSMKLNFFPDSALIPATVMIISLFPLVNLRFFTRMQARPVFIALLLSAILLKYRGSWADTGNSSFSHMEGIRLEQDRDHRKLILDLESNNPLNDESLFLLRKIHPDIKIIEISKSTYNNISACRILMNDFIIEECIVGNVESINAGFTDFLKILQKENIRVTIRQKPDTDTP